MCVTLLFRMDAPLPTWWRALSVPRLVGIVWLVSNWLENLAWTNATTVPRPHALLPTKLRAQLAPRHVVVVWLVSNWMVRLAWTCVTLLFKPDAPV